MNKGTYGWAKRENKWGRDKFFWYSGDVYKEEVVVYWDVFNSAGTGPGICFPAACQPHSDLPNRDEERIYQPWFKWIVSKLWKWIEDCEGINKGS